MKQKHILLISIKKTSLNGPKLQELLRFVASWEFHFFIGHFSSQSPDMGKKRSVIKNMAFVLYSDRE